MKRTKTKSLVAQTSVTKKKKKKECRLCGYIAQLIERRSARMAVEGSKPADGGFCLVLSFGGKLPKWNFDSCKELLLDVMRLVQEVEKGLAGEEKRRRVLTLTMRVLDAHSL